MTTNEYKRDENGHLFCECCGFKPKPTGKHPFGNPSTLFYHMKKHTNDFPYECSVCKSGFPQKQNLLNHMKARHPNHLKEKTNHFKCPIDGCSFQSVTKGNCLVHCARRHFDEIVDSYLEVQENNDVKTHHCLCCLKDYKSPTAYYYHVLKCLTAFELIDDKKVEQLLTVS